MRLRVFAPAHPSLAVSYEQWRQTYETPARVRPAPEQGPLGSGVVPGTRSGVLFRDALGRLNRRLADESEEVHLVVAGRVQRLDRGTA